VDRSIPSAVAAVTVFSADASSKYMLRSAFCWCAWGLGALASAQQAPPDPVTVMGSLDKQMGPMASTWLHSADPRMQAWGAYLVLRDRHTEAIPDLLGMLAGFPVVEEVATPGDADRHDVMLGVLDALIQFGAQVPAVDAERIYPEFPVQSLILLSRSQEDTTPALLAIFKSERRSPAAWLAAGALLLKRRAEGFAAAVVEAMTVHALVMVTEPGTGYGSGGSALCCGAGLPPKTKDGWPPLGVYAFGGCGDRLQPGATLLAEGTDPAYYHRQVNASYQVEGVLSCGCVPDRDLVRQHYLTTLLSDSTERPPVRAHVSHTIVWQGLDAYRSELVAFIGEQEHIFAELARRLGEQSLLSEVEVKSARPTLQMRVSDQRATQEPALPAVTGLAENITVEPF
jgi:hypothetical protein